MWWQLLVYSRLHVGVSASLSHGVGWQGVAAGCRVHCCIRVKESRCDSQYQRLQEEGEGGALSRLLYETVPDIVANLSKSVAS